MRISVLIPAWDRAQYLGQAIESVLAQTYRDFEIVVVDDGSTDDTAALVRRYAGVRYVYQPHRGVAAARNRALAEARGELIAWLDSDDLYAPDKLEKQAAYLDAHPECDIVFCLPGCFSDIAEERITAQQRHLQKTYETGFRQCLPSACIRRELFERLGGFDEKYAYAEDTEWIARIAAAGVDIRHCMEACLYICRLHDDQITYTHDQTGKTALLAIYADAIRRARKVERDHADHRE